MSTAPSMVRMKLKEDRGVLKSGHKKPYTNNVFPFPASRPTIVPLVKLGPLADDVTHPISYHRCAFPGLLWEYPVRVMCGNGPRFAVIEEGPVGMTMGAGTVEKLNGDWTVNTQSLNLRWESPVPGTYKIRIRVFDQNTSVVFKWTLVCSYSLFWFVAPQAMGTGDGLMPENAASLANTYIGSEVVGPSKDKILVVRGGDYGDLTIYQCYRAFNSNNVIGFPDEWPKFHCRFNDQDSDRFYSGLEWDDMELSYEGVIQTNTQASRLTLWRCKFKNIRKIGQSNNNQAVWFTKGLGTASTAYRTHILASENTYENISCGVNCHYSNKFLMSEREQMFVTDPLISFANTPMWFPKSGNRLYEYSNNIFDNPTVNVSTEGIFMMHSGATNGGYNRGFLERNFARCAGGAAVRLNTASNVGYTTDSIVWMRDNTVIGGDVISLNWDGGRFAYLDSNVIVNSSGGMHSSSVAYQATGTECYGTSGIVDANGDLLESMSQWRGSRGRQLYKGVA